VQTLNIETNDETDSCILNIASLYWNCRLLMYGSDSVQLHTAAVCDSVQLHTAAVQQLWICDYLNRLKCNLYLFSDRFGSDYGEAVDRSKFFLLILLSLSVTADCVNCSTVQCECTCKWYFIQQKLQ
jgi:hypothetical protein